MDHKGHNNQGVKWEKLHQVESNGIVVSISMLPLRFPQYSIEFLFRHKDMTRHFFPVKTEGQGAIRFSEEFPIETLGLLIEEAREFIRQHRQEAEDKVIEQRISREQTQIEREKPKPSLGLSKLGKVDARLRTTEVVKKADDETIETEH